MRLIKIVFAGILLVVCVTCKKDYYQSFPNIVVNISLSIDTDLSSLGIGSAMVSPIPGGVKGIIIYRSDLYEYAAYDRLCTNFPNDTCAVEIDDSKIIAESPCSGSKFLLIDGSVLNGPARYPLKRYTTTIERNRLFISN